METPVLIVGAGPVGMTMASELARFGVKVRIVDKAKERTDKSKALVVWSRTLELLNRGDRGSAPFVDAGFKVHAVNFIAGEKVLGRVTMDGVETPYSYALMLPQSETERLLEERLGRQGVTIERQVELASFNSNADGVEAQMRRADGTEETVSTDWLLGCDGAHSTVRHGLGDQFAGETLKSDWMLADVHMKGYPYPETEMSVFWHHEGVFVIFPISPGRFRIVADQPMTSDPHPPTPTLEQVQAIIDRRGPHGMTASDPVWLAGFRINGRKVSNYRSGRVFLSGDAAHVHSPAGGQGMNTGMQDAFNLSWKLASVIHKTCGEHLLDTYSAERSVVGDEVVRATDRLTAIGTLKNPVAQAVRNLVSHVMFGLHRVQQGIAENMTEVTIGYPNSPLNGPTRGGPGPKPGERMVPISGQTPIGSGSTPRFALFADHSAAASDLLKRFDRLLEPNLRPPLHDVVMWLVRPDGYVACSSTNAEDIAGYLEKLTQA